MAFLTTQLLKVSIMSNNDLDATTPNQDDFLSLTVVIKVKTNRRKHK